jgi:hypothetical protein
MAPKLPDSRRFSSELVRSSAIARRARGPEISRLVFGATIGERDYVIDLSRDASTLRKSDRASVAVPLEYL